MSLPIVRVRGPTVPRVPAVRCVGYWRLCVGSPTTTALRRPWHSWVIDPPRLSRRSESRNKKRCQEPFSLTWAWASGNLRSWEGQSELRRGVGCITFSTVRMGVCRFVKRARTTRRLNGVLEEAIDRTGTRLLSYRWSCGTSAERKILSPWPIRRSPGWLEYVNKPQTDAEFAALRRSVNRGSPNGDETWSATATESLGLEITTRPQGQPRHNGS